MARPSIPAAILRQRGVPLTLVDGREVTLCYTFSSLMRLEEEHGSIEAATRVVSAGSDGKMVTGLVGILAAGLEHEVDPDGLALSNTDNLRYLVDSQRIQDYSNAIGEAFTKAFPSAQASAGGDGDVDPTTPPPVSPGTGGTTSAPSPSDAQMTSSGV